MAYLTDGCPTTVQFFALGSSVTILLKETSCTPPGIEGGDANDTTTMRNTAWRTKQPKQFKELSDGSAEFQYDPAIYDQILSIINVNGKILWTFPDGSTLEHWGWLKNFTPGPLTEGSMPTASGTIIGGNQDDDGNEQAPVYTAAA